MVTALTICEVIASILLIAVVLLQSGKEAGLSGAMTGSSDSYMAKTKNSSMQSKLAASTKWIAAVWLLLTLSLSLI